ncbi:MAG: AAA family ATPase [Desulfobulbaceae bacterium]|nr:AAA family ATPase [Desulfobulbaceae bacterium]
MKRLESKTLQRLKVKKAVPAQKMDGNEKLVLRKCASYMYRHLSHHIIPDNESLEFACWILKEKVLDIGTFLKEQIKSIHIDRHKKGLPIDRRKMARMYEQINEVTKTGLDPDDYARAIQSILTKIPTKLVKATYKLILKKLEERHLELSSKKKSDIEKSLLNLQQMFSLTDKEAEVCLFFYILTSFDDTEKFFVGHLNCNLYVCHRKLLRILNLTKKDYTEIFSGTIKRIGLIEMDRYHMELNDDFVKIIEDPSGEITTEFFKKARTTHTSLRDHFVGDEQTDHVLKLLGQKRQTPTHILLYGAPGTGKTSYARGIAAKVGMPAFEITLDEERNESSHRRAAIMAGLNITNIGKGSVIIVDEADNILNTNFSWLMRGETQDKGWLNHLLEKPDTRIIWITNNIIDIEDSVLRRFAYSLHFKKFSRMQREILWENLLRKNKATRLLGNDEVKKLASRYDVSAGVIEMAIIKAKERGGKKTCFIEAVHLALNSYETLINGGFPKRKKEEIDSDYSLAGLNIEGDLAAIMQQMELFNDHLRQRNEIRYRNMNLLFYGVPGAGKSELARYIAKHLDRELLVKRLSDILDPFVGGTERNISRVFSEAENEEAVLVIDEADSLIFNRDAAVRSWEISCTNEFLSQMERFQGILICTTNRFDGLDEASLRRFNHKVGFRHLTPEGVEAFYDKFLIRLVNKPLPESDRIGLRNIASLSPGDFKVIRDRYGFYPAGQMSHKQLIHDLRQEACLKQMHGKQKAIGF